jgi:hypothetical protein
LIGATNADDTGAAPRAAPKVFVQSLPCRIVPVVLVHLIDGTTELFGEPDLIGRLCA